MLPAFVGTSKRHFKHYVKSLDDKDSIPIDYDLDPINADLDLCVSGGGGGRLSDVGADRSR